MRIEDALKTNKFRDEGHKAGLNLLYTAYWFNVNLNKLLKPFKITQEQFNVLRILRGSLPINLCVKDIGGRMIERSSNVPRIVDKLVRKGFVLRKKTSEIDKRETSIFITENGLEFLKGIDLVFADGEKKLMNLSEDEAKIFNELLEKVRSAQEE
jgi:DNA-binding MarR family transcriptional regulator